MWSNNNNDNWVHDHSYSDCCILCQLWENAVYFWTDLQHYHELFYQGGLDPYRLQREAQVSTYTHSATELILHRLHSLRKNSKPISGSYTVCAP